MGAMFPSFGYCRARFDSCTLLSGLNIAQEVNGKKRTHCLVVLLCFEMYLVADTFRWTQSATNSDVALVNNHPQYILTGNNARIAATLRYVKLVMPYREITLLRAD